MESTYFKKITLEMLKREFTKDLLHARILEMEMNLFEIREGSRCPGRHADPIMREMERWFHEQMDRIVRNERRWIDQIKGKVLVDDEVMENLWRIGTEARWKLDEHYMQMCCVEETLEYAKRKFVDTESEMILVRKRKEREAYLEYVTLMEEYYKEKLEICMYERLVAMLSNIRSLLE